MRVRLIKSYNKIQLLCADGSIINTNDDDLRRLFVGFAGAEMFRGKDGRWDEKCNDMEDYHGKSLAWVDDNGLLIIRENPFISLVEAVVDDEYVTIQEYAKEQCRHEARIKKLCQEGRILGAAKKGNRWFVPKNAPYPQDARYSGIDK